MKKLSDKLHLSQYSATHRSGLLEVEVIGVRDTLRAQEYISPDNVSPHATLKGDVLDKELDHFDDKACDNMNQYMRSVRDGHGFGHSRLVPCFVTPQDRAIYNDITNKTKQEIASANRPFVGPNGGTRVTMRQYY